MLKKTVFTILLSSITASSISIGHATNTEKVVFAGEYLSNISEQHKDIATEFSQLTKGILQQAPWVANYGTASPGIAVQVNEKDYVAFSACEPKNCPNSAYVVLLDPSTKTLTQGALRIESDEKTAPHQSTVVWLGQYDHDFVPTIWQQFYPTN